MSNILENTLENDKDAKAAIVAKIIDHEGPEFGSKLEMRSKVLQKSRKLNPEQTASLMAASGSTDYSWRVGRTAFLNTLCYTPISPGISPPPPPPHTPPISIIPRLSPEAWGWILEVDVGPVQQPSWPEYSP